MTKKHFEAAAAYVRAVRMSPRCVTSRSYVTTCHAIEDAFVAVFRKFNPRFDVDRFRADCRGEDATDRAGRTVRYGVRA